MKLNTYRQKRDFSKTNEPMGSGKKAKHIFSIQFHRSRRAHYDLRLEYGGVLLSWAVPKGPSTNPRERRLAVRVEDHPVEYADFEGEIPQGQYGAGTVEVWDKGTYLPNVDFKNGLKDGSLKFTLLGKRLKGDWALVRTDEKNWLLIKEKENRIDVKLPFDSFEYKKAKAISSLPTGDDFLYEIKYDGFRMAAFISDKITIYSRNHIDMTEKFAVVEAELKKLMPHTAVIDGEMVAMTNGKTDFGAISRYSDKACFVAFDLLALDGKDLRELPLVERRKKLEKLIKGTSIIFSKAYDDGQALFESAKQLGLEGVVCKRKSEPYTQGEWYKLKCRLRQEFVICGYVSKKREIGSLVLGLNRGGSLVYVGNVGTGISQKTATLLKKEFEGLSSPTPTLDTGLKNVCWLKPVLMAEVEFAEWTESDKLRQPCFKGLRRDKDASTVVNEDPSAIFGVTVTNPQKQIFTSPVVTKGEVAAYYGQIASLMLPYLKGRPITVVRCNQGVEKCFFKKHPNGDKTKSIYIESESDILKEVQLGTVEFHVLCHQDPLSYLVFDLDPDKELPLGAIRQGVRDVIAELDALKLRSFVKLSGGKGYHIVTPVMSDAIKADFSEFAKSLAKLLEAKYPDRYTSNIKKDKRHAKIFIDWQRNSPSATVVAPFSLRARQGATISLPIPIKKLDSIAPDQADIRNYKSLYDPDAWKGFFK